MDHRLTHHELTAQWVDDSQGRAIMLTQPADNFDEPNTVLVHPWQLRAVCEQFSIIASDPQAAKTIATQARRLLVLAERIDHLADWMTNHADHKHADLSYGTTQLQALQDLAREWCFDFTEEGGTEPPKQPPAPAKPTTGANPVNQPSKPETAL